jgi:exosortase
MIVALGAGLGALFWSWLRNQHQHSWSHEDWSHSYFVPLISLYILWQHRADLARASVSIFWPGLAVFLLGIVCYVFFLIGFPNHMGQGYSLVITLLGMVLLMTGPRVMEVVFLPMSYMLLGVTIANKLEILITFRLQQVATQGAYVLLRILGVQADLRGNVIDITRADGTRLPPLNVAEACSGMSMLIAFLALGVAVALVACSRWWQRVVLVMMAVPVAVGLNVLRIAVLGLLSLADSNLASGEAHTLIGTLLLVPGLGAYMGIVWILNHVVSSDDRRPPTARGPSASAGGSAA